MFSGEEQKEYRTAKEIVGDVSLIDVALFFRDNRDKYISKKASVGVVVEDVLKNLNNTVTQQHRGKVERWFRRFEKAFDNKDFSSIQKKDVMEWIRGLKVAPGTIVDVARIITFLYARAESLGYTKERLHIDKNFIPKNELKEVEVYSTEEVSRILSYAHKNCSIWLPNIALRVFVGLRTSEASQMFWEWIDFEKKRIVVPAKICKTRDAWVLQSPNLPETVFEWLSLTPKEKRVGKIPCPPKRLSRVIKLPLKTNGFRHTFCTMHISLYGSADKTATLLKHKGTSMLYKHYLGKLVPEDEAKAYFNLTPQSLLSNP
jgi:integrase